MIGPEGTTLPPEWVQRVGESELDWMRRVSRLIQDQNEFDPIRQAILNIQMAEGRVMRVWEWTQNEELNEAIADLQQAVRFLTGEETPS